MFSAHRAGRSSDLREKFACLRISCRNGGSSHRGSGHGRRGQVYGMQLADGRRGRNWRRRPESVLLEPRARARSYSRSGRSHEPCRSCLPRSLRRESDSGMARHVEDRRWRPLARSPEDRANATASASLKAAANPTRQRQDVGGGEVYPVEGLAIFAAAFGESWPGALN